MTGSVRHRFRNPLELSLLSRDFQVNQFLNDPSAQQRSSNNFTELSDDHDLNSLISGMSSSELAQLFRGLGGSPNLFPLVNNRSRASRAAHDEAMETETAPAATATATAAQSTASSGKREFSFSTGLKLIRLETYGELFSPLCRDREAGRHRWQR